MLVTNLKSQYHNINVLKFVYFKVCKLIFNENFNVFLFRIVLHGVSKLCKRKTKQKKKYLIN